VHPSRESLLRTLADEMGDVLRPDALIVGALGRTGRGAVDLLAAMEVRAQLWDKAETARQGPFPEILAHEVFLNCILAVPGGPVFVPQEAAAANARRLRVIADIACDAQAPIRRSASTTARPAGPSRCAACIRRRCWT